MTRMIYITRERLGVILRSTMDASDDDIATVLWHAKEKTAVPEACLAQEIEYWKSRAIRGEDAAMKAVAARPTAPDSPSEFTDADLHHLTERGVTAWAGVDAQALRTGDVAGKDVPVKPWGRVIESGGTLIAASSMHGSKPLPVGALIYATSSAAMAEPVAEFPDDGELEAWRATADDLLRTRRDPSMSMLLRAAQLLQNAYLFASRLRFAQQTPQQAPHV